MVFMDACDPWRYPFYEGREFGRRQDTFSLALQVRRTLELIRAVLNPLVHWVSANVRRLTTCLAVRSAPRGHVRRLSPSILPGIPCGGKPRKARRCGNRFVI